MPRLTRPRTDEKGAIVVFMAAAVVVLVGMAALVIDVGAIRNERRQLQNGADAAALAVAQRCALAPCGAPGSPTAASMALAKDLAGANAQDGKSSVTVSFPSPNQVEVITSTDGGSGAILPYNFGQVVTGKKGTTVRAKATASWGPASTAPAVPLAVSQCDLARLRAPTNGPVFEFAGSGCESKDAPGAFGWLDGACETTGPPSTWKLPTFIVGTRASADPGKSGPKDCLDGLKDKDIIIPVFDDVTGNGNNTTYRIVGFAAIRLTGWGFPGDESTPRPCRSNQSCLQGTFINFVTAGPTGAGAGFGVSAVKLVS